MRTAIARNTRIPLQLSVLALAFLVARPGSAAESVQLVGQWPGYPRQNPTAIEVAGEQVYLATVNGLSVLSAGDPVAMLFLGYVDLGVVGGWDIAISGDRAALCFGSQPLRIIDVADPQNPTELIAFQLTGITRSIQLVGRYAYASQLTDGLRIVDLEAVGGPKVVRTLATVARGRMQFLGDRGFVPTSTGMDVFLFSDPTTATKTGAYIAGVNASHVALAGDRACLAAGNGVHILDIASTSPPSDPTQLGFYPTSDETLTIQLGGNRAYVTCADGSVKVLELSQPAAPALLGEYGTTGEPRGLGLRGDHALVLDYDNVQARSTLEVVDFADPEQPRLADLWETTGTASEIGTDGVIVYLADGQAGLSIVNAQVPATPVLEVAFNPASEYVRCVDLAGDLVCLGVDAGLRVVNVSDPVSPAGVGFYPTLFGWVSAVKMVPERVYMASGFGMGELTLLSLTNPAAPTRMGGYFLSGDVLDLEAIGNWALVAEGPAGLEVIDWTDPNLPARDSLYQPGPAIHGIALMPGSSSARIGLATGNGLEIVEIAGDGSVVPVGSWGAPGLEARHVYVAETRTFLQGVDVSWILDTTQASDPQLLGEVPTGLGNAVAVGDLLFSPAKDWGLRIYRVVSGAPGPTLQYVRLPSGQLRMEWSAAGSGWNLQFRDDLGTSGNWQSYDGSSTVTQWDVPVSGPQRFLRLSE